jgi:Phage terminase large subunit gpA, ATPase domain
VGFTIDLNPRSILIVFPNIDLAASFSRERMEPMIEMTPRLKAKVTDVAATTRNDRSSTKKKRYPGGFLNLVGANSTAGLSSRPVPIVIMDEVRRLRAELGTRWQPDQADRSTDGDLCRQEGGVHREPEQRSRRDRNRAALGGFDARLARNAMPERGVRGVASSRHRADGPGDRQARLRELQAILPAMGVASR